MPGKNPAQRISELIERGKGLDGNTALIDGLSQLFEYAPQDAYREHVYRLEQVQKQLDLMAAGLRRLGVPHELYAHQHGVLKNAFSASNLTQHYQSLKGQLTADVLLGVRWAAFILEDEGGIADQQALDELVAAIVGLIADVQASALPPTLSEFLVSHLNDLLVGLQTNPFAGAGDLQKAVKTLAADAVANGEALNKAADLLGESEQALMVRAGVAFNQAAEIAGESGKGSAGIPAVWRLATKNTAQLGWDAEAIPQLGHNSSAVGED